MFNGIVFNTGVINEIKTNKNSKLIEKKTNLKLKKKDIGSSIACDGVCLTLSNIKKNIIFFYLSKETIKRSSFKFLKKGKIINLEKSLVYGQKISGHFTQGHVDTTARVKEIKFIDKSWELFLEISNKRLNNYLVEKASVSVNGVSLTISKISKKYFILNIIPHTLKLTNLKHLRKNDFVNVELDIFSKYIYKYSN